MTVLQDNIDGSNTIQHKSELHLRIIKKVKPIIINDTSEIFYISHDSFIPNSYHPS
jgi:hypothetical protein